MQCMDISYHSYLCNCNHLYFHMIPFARGAFANFCYWPWSVPVNLWFGWLVLWACRPQESRRRNAKKTNQFPLGNHTPRSLARAQKHKAANFVFLVHHIGIRKGLVYMLHWEVLAVSLMIETIAFTHLSKFGSAIALKLFRWQLANLFHCLNWNSCRFMFVKL